MSMGGLRRGPWTAGEDEVLMNLVAHQGALNWVRISQMIRSRTPKQCRERYHQNLKPTLNHDPITPEEGRLIEEMVRTKGKRWAEIARGLHGRSDNAVKNWWNGSQNRRKRSMAGRRHGAAEYGPVDNMDSSAHLFAAPPAPAALHSVPRTLAYPQRSHPLRLDSSNFNRPFDTPLQSPGLPSPSADSVDMAPSLMSDSGSHYTTSPRASSSHSASPVEQIRLPPLKYMHDPSEVETKIPGLTSLKESVPGLGLPRLARTPPSATADLHVQLAPLSLSHLPTAPNSPVHNLPALREGAREPQPPREQQQRESRMHLSGLLN